MKLDLSFLDNIENEEDRELMRDLFIQINRGFESVFKKKYNMSSEEGKRYADKYRDSLEFFYIYGYFVDGKIYYTNDPAGKNGPSAHYPRPFAMIDIIKAEEYFKSKNIFPDEDDWRQFEILLDEEGEGISPLYDEKGEIRYLWYSRFNSREVCYYDIAEEKLVETGLLETFDDDWNSLFDEQTLRDYIKERQSEEK